MKRYVDQSTVAVFVGVVVFIFLVIWSAPASDSYKTTDSSVTLATSRDIIIASTTIHAIVAATPAAREKGLGGRAGLEPTQGMLFIFPEDGAYAFWMKDMQFSIDIIWFAADGMVVGMWQNVAPNTYPRAYAPDAPARYVLEVPAGFVASHQVKIGSIARL